MSEIIEKYWLHKGCDREIRRGNHFKTNNHHRVHVTARCNTMAASGGLFILSRDISSSSSFKDTEMVSCYIVRSHNEEVYKQVLPCQLPVSEDNVGDPE